MEKKLIAKKLLALAKNLVTGGGAGIKMSEVLSQNGVRWCKDVF